MDAIKNSLMHRSLNLWDTNNEMRHTIATGFDVSLLLVLILFVIFLDDNDWNELSNIRE